jgi:TolA-binding protein
MSQKKPLNVVAIGVGALCVVLLIAIMAIYINYNSMLVNKDGEISSLKDQLANAGIQPNPSVPNPDTSDKDAQIADLQNQVAQLQSENNNLNSQISSLQSQINSLKAANLISVNMKYEDNRPFLQDAYMHVYGYVANTGTNTANNAKIHVIIYQGATVAKDTTVTLGSISGKSSASVDTKIYYTGSAITTYSANLEFT